MATGWVPILPLTEDAEDGFAMHKRLAEAVKQNIKMILLTIPGEFPMKPQLGVGLKRYLFEQNTNRLREEISSKIKIQLASYLPFVTINKITFSDVESPLTDENKLSLTLEYSIDNLALTDYLTVP